MGTTGASGNAGHRPRGGAHQATKRVAVGHTDTGPLRNDTGRMGRVQGDHMTVIIAVILAAIIAVLLGL